MKNKKQYEYTVISDHPWKINERIDDKRYEGWEVHGLPVPYHSNSSNLDYIMIPMRRVKVENTKPHSIAIV